MSAIFFKLTLVCGIHNVQKYLVEQQILKAFEEGTTRTSNTRHKYEVKGKSTTVSTEVSDRTCTHLDDIAQDSGLRVKHFIR